jgi:hypothetical protein
MDAVMREPPQAVIELGWIWVNTVHRVGIEIGRQRFAVTQYDTTGIKTGSGFSTSFAMVEIRMN